MGRALEDAKTPNWKSVKNNNDKENEKEKEKENIPVQNRTRLKLKIRKVVESAVIDGTEKPDGTTNGD